jgi:hypothetical protein
MSDQSVVPGKPSLAARIDEEKSHPLAWKTVARRAALAVIAGIAIYLVFPAITCRSSCSAHPSTGGWSMRRCWEPWDLWPSPHSARSY